jgi:ribosomal protein L37AE/L43A
MGYLIVLCRKCDHPSLARGDQKVRTCPFCGAKLFIGKAKILAKAEDGETASLILRKLKMRMRT